MDGVNITSKQLLWGFIIVQHRKQHSSEQKGIHFQGTLQAESDFTQRGMLYYVHRVKKTLGRGNRDGTKSRVVREVK